jgi:hypothetical protein
MSLARGLSLVIVASACVLTGCALPKREESVLPVATPDKGAHFSARILGHWRTRNDATCAAGPMVTRDGPRVTVTHGVELTAYEIVSEAALELRARIVAPASRAGAIVVMRPEFNATREMRSFNLILENDTTGANETWAPCEVG